jgi:uncharacterized protein (DUF2345 family)
MPSTSFQSHTTASMSTSTTAVLAANRSRKFVLVVNDSDTDVYLKIGVAAVANQGIRINANGGSFTMSPQHGNLDQRAINGITSSGSSKTVLVTEGV